MRAVYLMIQIQSMREMEKCLTGELIRICHAAKELGQMTDSEFPEALVHFYRMDEGVYELPKGNEMPYVVESELVEFIRRTVGLLALFK
jgi:hypothetical protein